MFYERYVLDKFSKKDKKTNIIDSVVLKYMSNGQVVDLLNALINKNQELEINIKWLKEENEFLTGLIDDN